MPKLEMPGMKEIRSAIEKSKFISNSALVEILEEKLEGRYLGEGEEAFVIAMEDGSHKIAAAYNYSGLAPFEAKRIFYGQRIFSTLFPHNFPNFHAAFSSSPRTYPGAIRKLVGAGVRQIPDIAERHSFLRKLFKFKYPFKDVIKKAKEFDFDFVGPIDTGPVSGDYEYHHRTLDLTGGSNHRHFLRGEDGGEYYVDTVKLETHTLDINKVMEFMRRHNYSTSDQHIVKTCYDRLVTLSKEEIQARAKEQEEYQKRKGLDN